eukprot:5387393-Amphidinium_carterae.1
MSSKMWAHAIRDLLRVHAYVQASDMQRGLNKEGAFNIDGFILHHILVKGRLDTSQETFATDGLTTGDRMRRHKNLCDGVCENCLEPDTAEHRLYSCTATRHIREHVLWQRQDDEIVASQGHACSKYGLWALPPHVRNNCSDGLLSLLDASVVREFFDYVAVTCPRYLVIQLAVQTYKCRHPLGTFSWLNVQLKDDGGEGVIRTFFCERVSNGADPTFGVFILCWMLASSFNCSVTLEGELELAGLAERLQNPSDLWSSVRYLCEDRALSSIQCQPSVICPSPLDGWAVWPKSLEYIERARVLSQNVGTCEKQRLLMSGSMGLYPCASTLSHQQKRCRFA